jgi:hypothetical protein
MFIAISLSFPLSGQNTRRLSDLDSGLQSLRFRERAHEDPGLSITSASATSATTRLFARSRRLALVPPGLLGGARP